MEAPFELVWRLQGMLDMLVSEYRQGYNRYQLYELSRRTVALA
jgi:hypothetical protein